MTSFHVNSLAWPYYTPLHQTNTETCQIHLVTLTLNFNKFSTKSDVIGVFRASLTTEASKTIAAAIVGSRLDYCNSLLAGTSISNLTRLQRVQNTLARVVAENLGSATSHLFFLICIGFRFATELALKLLRLPSECSNFSSHHILHLSSQSMYRREHSALLQLCQYVFLHVKPPSQPPNHFHLLLQISGTHCQIICHPFQLFLLFEELLNITYSCLLTLTVVRNLVRSNQLNVSRSVIQSQLLPSLSPEIPCRPSKGVPSERLRLVKWFISHRLHTGKCVNLVLLTYLLTR